MAFELDRGDRRVLAIAAGVFVVLVVIALLLSPDSDRARELPTTYSAASGGARAAWLLLRESGYHVERWERPPADLADPAGKLLILADPGGFPGTADRASLERFVRRGGRVLAIGAQAAFFFPEPGVHGEAFATNTWKQIPAVAPSAVTRAAPHITLAPWAFWPADASGVPLYADDEKTRVLEQPVGEGEIMFWASATPLTNAGIRETGNLEFFLACVGDRARVTILWDEYFHGYRQSLARSAARSPLGWLFIHLVVVALAVVLTHSRRSGPVIVSGRDTRLSPLEFVRTLGHLYERAGAAAVAVDVSYSRFRYWLTRRLGVPGDASPEVLEAALAERWGFRDVNFRATLDACEAARGRLGLKGKDALRLVRDLHRQASALKLFER